MLARNAIPAQVVSTNLPGNSASQNTSGLEAPQSVYPLQGNDSFLPPTTALHDNTPNLNSGTSQASTALGLTNLPLSTFPDSDATGALYPENPYSSEEELEWNEQEDASASLDINAFISNTDTGDDDVKKTMDGMATLTIDAANYGYLGTTSGASHLRTLWMGTDDTVAWDQGSRNARRKHMEQLLRRQSLGSAAQSFAQTQTFITQAMANTFVDAYFALYHNTFPILHEPTFRAQYARLVRRPNKDTWLALANVVAAAGAFIVSSCSDDTDVTIFRTAKHFLSMNSLEAGNLTLVQAFGLSANYLQKRNKPNTGYNYGGLAIRLAIGLGLHKDIVGQNTTPFKQEMRRRVWWALCVLDVGATITYSRPLIWPQMGVDAPLPLNIHETDLLVESANTPREVEQATIYTYIRVQSSYHLQTMGIYNRLISSQSPSAQELVSLDDDIIHNWLRQVPYFFRDDISQVLDPRFALGHGINMWRFRNMRIIMYRPFLVRWALGGQKEVLPWQDQMATDRCLQAAKESIALIKSFWAAQSHHRLAAFYVLYFLFQATLIPIHCLRCMPQDMQAAAWRNQIRDALAVVESMKSVNQSSSKCRDVILSLCGESLQDPDSPPLQYLGDAMASSEQRGGGGSGGGGARDATAWMVGCAPALINEDLWPGSFERTIPDFEFGNWDAWNL
ncbi:hypothetical protein MBLNU459_g5809t1 [Dothideomycetes sp. NU459]